MAWYEIITLLLQEMLMLLFYVSRHNNTSFAPKKETQKINNDKALIIHPNVQLIRD